MYIGVIVRYAEIHQEGYDLDLLDRVETFYSDHHLNIGHLFQNFPQD